MAFKMKGHTLPGPHQRKSPAKDRRDPKPGNQASYHNSDVGKPSHAKKHSPAKQGSAHIKQMDAEGNVISEKNIKLKPITEKEFFSETPKKNMVKKIDKKVTASDVTGPSGNPKAVIGLAKIAKKGAKKASKLSKIAKNIIKNLPIAKAIKKLNKLANSDLIKKANIKSPAKGPHGSKKGAMKPLIKRQIKAKKSSPAQQTKFPDSPHAVKRRQIKRIQAEVGGEGKARGKTSRQMRIEKEVGGKGKAKGTRTQTQTQTQR